MSGPSRLIAFVTTLLPVLFAAAVLAAAAILGAGRIQRPDARSPVPLRPGEYRGPTAREWVERGGTGPFGMSPVPPSGAPSPGAIDDPDGR